MIVELHDDQWLWFTQILPAEEEVLWKHFSIAEPRSQFIDVEAARWDGIHRFYNRSKQRMVRPLLSMLKRVCKENGVVLDVQDKRPEPEYWPMDPEEIGPDFLPGITMEPYQVDAIRKACKVEVGIVCMPTGGGKCVCGETKITLDGIGAVEIGDVCKNLAEEEFTTAPEGMTVLGPHGNVPVRHIYKTNKRDIMRLELQSNHVLRGVPEHRVYTRRSWVMLQDLKPDDEVAVDEETMRFVPIKSLNPEPEQENCYDLQLEDDGTELSHAYWTSGVLSHNTEIMAGIAKAIECPTLILANQTVVLDQIKSRLELRAVAEEVGLFYAGKRPGGQVIVVGSVQSLVAPTKEPQFPNRTAKDTDRAWTKKLDKYGLQCKAFKTRVKNARVLQKLAKQAHMIMVDECDLASSKLYKQVFKYICKARRRVGFSGTPFDESKPVQNMVVQSHLGGIIATESRNTVQDLGRIIPIKYKMLVVDGDPKEASTYDLAFKEHISQSEHFWNLVVSLCQRHPDEGTLILVDKEELGNSLSQELSAVGIEAPFIYGKTPKKKRNDALNKFQSREIKVLIGGKIINRGLDLKSGCENLIIATGGKLKSDFNQKLGRAVRINAKGYSRVYDFYFRCNRYLYPHSRARLCTVLELGYEATVYYPGGSVDGAELVKRRYRFPKPKPAAQLQLPLSQDDE